MGLGGTSGVNQATPSIDHSTSRPRKSPKWTTEQNLNGSLFVINHAIVVSACPMGRDAAKKAKTKGKGAVLEVVNEEFNVYKKLKEQELKCLDNIAMMQEEAI
ncbi:PREDICTED: uncharacterized protein LOC109132240 [Camelina sativa]|uniref:Uncharacterized protein LOC109132240 n=1 Tax=Camelina sativa TaxID=90675 RepID=A0ABM1RJD0_CAMSA|nr:PREDICTED: uncharacterized protein LOC109132240 [Camelina sativa]